MLNTAETHASRTASGLAMTAPVPWAGVSDEQLFGRYQERADRDAFSELVRRYERELFSFLRRYLGDAEMAEDVFQATFMQIHLKLDQFDTSRRFRPWLYRVATNQAIDYQRRNRRHRMGSLERQAGAGDEEAPKLAALLATDDRGPAERLEISEQKQWVRDQLQEMSEALRQVVLLVFFQGLKYREVSEVLGIPVGTVKSRMFTAVNQLSQAWEDRFGSR